MENLVIHFEYTGLEELIISNIKTFPINHIVSYKFSLNPKPYSFQDVVYVLIACQNLLSTNVFT